MIIVRIRHLMSIWIHVIFSGFQLKFTYTTYRYVKKKENKDICCSCFFFNFIFYFVCLFFGCCFFLLYAWVNLVLVFLSEGCLLKQWNISVDQIKARKSSNSISFIILLWVYNTSELLTVLGLKNMPIVRIALSLIQEFMVSI